MFKSALIILATLSSLSAFAQSDHHGNNYPNNYPNTYPSNSGTPIQTIQVQAGSSTMLNVLVPTQVTCVGNSMPTVDASLLCTVAKSTDSWGNVYYVVKQVSQEKSDRRSTMDAAIADLEKLRKVGLCN